MGSRFRKSWMLGMGCAASVAVPAPGRAAVVPAEVVAQSGEVVLGSAVAVSSVAPPFALADGTVAFVGLLADGDGFVFLDDQIVWRGSDELVLVLSGAEAAMGASPGGGFIYSPLVDGAETVWTHNGLLALEGQAAPLFAAGTTSTFHSRPTMTSDGAVYWVAGLNSTGGAATEDRVLYRSAGAAPGDEEVILATGEIVDGLTIESPAGIDLDYQVSPDGLHLIALLGLETGSVDNNGHVYLDGALLHQEGTLNGDGDNWDSFDLVSVNSHGAYAFSGDTTGAIGSDEFVAVNGTIAIREGDVVDGVTLTTPATVRLVAISETGRVAHAWSHGAAETLFYACDPDDPAGSSLAVLTTDGDELDLDGDGVGDGAVTDFDASTLSASRSLVSDGLLYVEVDLDGVNNMIVRVPVTCCGNGVVDFDEMCDDGNADDTDACPSNCLPASCGDGFVQAGVEDCDDGNPANTDACLTSCTPASCGDGFLWAGVEECDDDNGDDTDACPQTCMLAECGDGFVWAGEEDCDDGNAVQTDACLDDCTAASCGDGLVWDGVEDCDDGNTEDGDECPADCLIEGGSSSDGGDTDGGSTSTTASTDDSGGSTSGADTTGSSGVGGTAADDTGDTSGTTASMPPAMSTGEGSSGGSSSSGGVPFGGLDDDGGCTCRASTPANGRGGWLLWLVVLAARRRSTSSCLPSGGRERHQAPR